MSRKEVYLSIGKAANILGVSASSLRNWEAIGLLAPIRSRGRLLSRPLREQSGRVLGSTQVVTKSSLQRKPCSKSVITA